MIELLQFVSAVAVGVIAVVCMLFVAVFFFGGDEDDDWPSH